MNEITRRRFLAFIGAGAGALAATGVPGARAAVGPGSGLTPVRLPHPLPIYTQRSSYLATGIGSGNTLPPEAVPNLAEFTTIDDVVVPPEYERYVIVAWGDRPFADPHQYVGYNHDYTAFVSRTGSPYDGYLWVNHEYVSFPFSTQSPGIVAGLGSSPQSFEAVVGAHVPAPFGPYALPTTRTAELIGETYYNQGGSILRLRRQTRAGRYEVVAGDPGNRRIHGLSGLGINDERTDGLAAPASWGTLPHQIGDENFLIGTGPAATDVFEAVNADGLGNRIIGTAFNCSGATSTWGTVLTAEENFQGSSSFWIGVQEAVKPNGSQTGYLPPDAQGNPVSGTVFGLVGEKYGWIVEIDPRDPSVRARKHTALGRFRHENLALRVAAGQHLVGYLGDDRRGGHTWKYVSSGVVTKPTDPANSELLEDGTLYVARYNPDGTGTWIPLALTTPTNPLTPTELSSVERASRSDGLAQQNGRLPLPRRVLTGGGSDGGSFIVDRTNEATALPPYQGKTLADFYPNLGAALCDAFLVANLIGGTPGARPEDVEVHPITRHVHIAFTDGAASSDGYPDSRIFVVAKYSTAIDDTQPSGSLFKIVEDSADGAGTTFTWSRFLQAGEVGADDGAGFAALDNLAFDAQGNVWGVTDMSTGSHNGFQDGPAGTPLAVDHQATVVPNAVLGNPSPANLIGVFGNNFMFFVPTKGPLAGQVVPFAYGPTRCELTGPTFLSDTLIISVQHPGEDCPINDGTAASRLSRSIEMLAMDGSLFAQTRNVPRGSNWPSNLSGNPLGPPRPCTIGIRRIRGAGAFV